MRRVVWRAAIIGLIGLSLLEIAGHLWVQSTVAARDDFVAAAAAVRARLREGDQVVAAPGWVEPRVREALGDAMTTAQLGASDLAPFGRLFEISIRGATSEARTGPDAASVVYPAEWQQAFGQVTVTLYRLTHDRAVRFDLVRHLAEGDGVRVFREDGGREVACPLRNRQPEGGGLGRGAMKPARRYSCDARADHLWVAATTTESLDLRPRYCVYQHPQGAAPIVVEFDDVPAGDQFVMYGGLYSEHERLWDQRPTDIRVTWLGANEENVEPVEVLHWTHRGGDGWSARTANELSLPTEEGSERGRLRVSVSSPDPMGRTFCWSATMRGPL